VSAVGVYAGGASDTPVGIGDSPVIVEVGWARFAPMRVGTDVGQEWKTQVHTEAFNVQVHRIPQLGGVRQGCAPR
jgi:hypothetical protein